MVAVSVGSAPGVTKRAARPRSSCHGLLDLRLTAALLGKFLEFAGRRSEFIKTDAPADPLQLVRKNSDLLEFSLLSRLFHFRQLLFEMSDKSDNQTAEFPIAIRHLGIDGGAGGRLKRIRVIIG